MGEAKQRAASVLDHAAIDARLRELGIDTAQFGFYDQPAFMAQELRDGAFLGEYANWVASRPRTDDYDARVRAVVPKLASFVADLLKGRDMRGSCVHASSMLPPMLERMGIWSFGLKGALTMEVPSRGIWRGLATCDHRAFENAELGHSWVMAPPFFIVDSTVKLQNLPNDPISEFMPKFVASEGGEIVAPGLKDIVSASVIAEAARYEGRADPQLHHRLEPELRGFGRIFPAREVHVDELVLRYVPIGARMSDVPLEEINADGGPGLTGAEAWDEHVAPAFNGFLV